MQMKGLKHFENYIKKAGKLLDTSNFHAKASMVMLQSVKRNFLNKKNSDGSGWKALKFRKGQALRDTGRLFGSITNAYDKKNAVVGTNVKYAAVHQYGYNFKPTKKQRGFFLSQSILKNIAFASVVKIPKREYMFLSKDGGEKVEKLTTNMLGKL